MSAWTKECQREKVERNAFFLDKLNIGKYNYCSSVNKISQKKHFGGNQK